MKEAALSYQPSALSNARVGTGTLARPCRAKARLGFLATRTEANFVAEESFYYKRRRNTDIRDKKG